jgi:anti-sigma B factor antagonist
MSSSSLSPLLSVSVVPDRARVRVIAAGEIDLSTVRALHSQLVELLDSGWRDVTVDLREVGFMDSSGLHALLEARRRTQEADGRLTVLADPGPVAELLHITGNGELLTPA